MRIFIKGGVWKNTEDEILKVAVMKYGKNQWARISSLLVRKSAKQCKARWYEWLDPSIKKTEWTRDEDEKLLHLAKLMPTQWRTIAPIVGRTPSQCLERYDKLLDAACAKDENYDPADDPRRLRPGEIDPQPETKPARPDPVDMDEDEKEMLNEARARLANTKGKKAKRKAREKQLEEARRLASLQKRRELKAAGIELRRKQKSKGIDYNAEVPFQRKAPAGFHDTTGEDSVQGGSLEYINKTLEQLDGRRRVDIEAQRRKEDIARNKMLAAHDMPASVTQINKMNDPAQVRKKMKLNLPAPQISDRELEEIAKLGAPPEVVVEDEFGDGAGAASSVTRGLLADYRRTPARTEGVPATPLRTPQRQGTSIMHEAENLARLVKAKTPLLGGQNPELHPSDFSGVTPKRVEVQTPNPNATPARTPATGRPGVGATPGRGGGVLMVAGTPAMTPRATPLATPIRDELHINEAEALAEANWAEKRRQAELRRELKAGLSALPVPKNEYQIMVPEMPAAEEPAEEMEEDAADILKRQEAAQREAEAREMRRRSQAIQRGLPRPLSTVLLAPKPPEHVSALQPLEQAEESVKREMLALLQRDAARFPLATRKKGVEPPAVPQLEDFDEALMDEASKLIREEASALRVAMGHDGADDSEYRAAWDACSEELLFLPALQRYGRASTASHGDRVASLQHEHGLLRGVMDTDAKLADKLEKKAGVITGGFQSRNAKVMGQLASLHNKLETLATELACFRAMEVHEARSAAARLQKAKEDVAVQKERERILQHRYSQLLEERDELLRAARLKAEKAKAAKDVPASYGADQGAQAMDAHPSNGAVLEAAV